MGPTAGSSSEQAEFTLQVDEVKGLEVAEHPGCIQVGLTSSQEFLNVENLSQLWSEKERCRPLFEAGGRVREPGDMGTFQKLEKARKWILPWNVHKEPALPTP